MEVDYYQKYLKYKNKYLELKAQMGGEDKCNKIGRYTCALTKGCKYDKDIKKCRQIYCHERDILGCTLTSGCTNKYDKQGHHIGCKQKHCWGRKKDFCKNVGIQDKKHTNNLFGTTGCEYDDKAGCRMKCEHIITQNHCGKLDECEWNGSCKPKEKPSTVNPGENSEA
jgi:hypothetical protein